MKSLTRIIILLALTASVLTSHAQQPTPTMVVVQAAGTPSSNSPAAVNQPSTEENTAILKNAITLLEQAKGANADLLKKQEDMLERLDEMQKAANQLRIFARRSGG
jgi:hypothetical protein